VKRKNQTIFLYAEPNEKINDLKAKIAKINEKSPHELGLIFNDVRLDNDKTVGDYKIENDNIVYLVYKNAGSDDYEDIDIQKPKPADETEGKE